MEPLVFYPNIKPFFPKSVLILNEILTPDGF